MNGQGQGTISPTDLMKKLVSARKVMDKVETGNYERGNVDENILRKAPEEINVESLPTTNMRPVGTADVDRINQSKLPDAIKKAMIESPIPQITLNDTINMDFVKGAKRLMEQEGIQTKSQQPRRNVQQTYTPPPSNTSTNVDWNSISVLIENTVRKVLDEKLNQLLAAQQSTSINENLVLRVGDSIFKGKITGVNKAK